MGDNVRKTDSKDESSRNNSSSHEHHVRRSMSTESSDDVSTNPTEASEQEPHGNFLNRAMSIIPGLHSPITVRGKKRSRGRPREKKSVKGITLVVPERAAHVRRFSLFRPVDMATLSNPSKGTLADPLTTHDNQLMTSLFIEEDRMSRENSEIDINSESDEHWSEFDDDNWSASTVMIRKSSRKLQIENIFHLLNEMHYTCEASKMERAMRDDDNTKKILMAPTWRMAIHLVVLYGILLAVFNAFAIGYLSISPEKYEHPYACHTKNCEHTVNWLKSSMDESVHPCDNFYEFMCGKYKQDSSENISTAAFFSKQRNRGINIDYLENQRLGAFLKRVEDFPANQILPYYQACLFIEHRDRVAYEPFASFLAGHGLLKLRTQEADGSPFNIGQILGRLYRSTNKLFFFDIVGINANYIYVKSAEPEIAILKKSGSEYIGAMYDAFTLMHKALQIDVSEISTVVKVVALFETELNTILTNMKNVFPLGYPSMISQDPRLYHSPWGKHNHPNFNDKRGIFEWEELLSSLLDYPPDPSGRYPVLFNSFYSIKLASDQFNIRLLTSLINKTPAYTIFRYLQWSLIKLFAFDLTTELETLMHPILNVPPTSRVEMCFRSLFHNLHIIAAHRYIVQNMNSKTLYAQASRIVKNVEKIISSTEFYIPKESKLHGILNDTVTRLHFIEEPIAIVEKHFKEFYHGMDLSPTENFENVIQTLTVKARNGMKNFLKIPPFHKWPKGEYDLSVITEDVVVLENTENKYVHVPFGALQEPYMSNDLPVLNYAGFGYWLVTTKFMMSILEQGLTRINSFRKTSFELKEHIIERDAMISLSESIGCILDLYSQISVDNINFNPVGPYSHRVILTDTISVQTMDFLLEALSLRSSLLPYPHEFPNYQVLYKMEKYTEEQLFFMALARQVCGSYPKSILFNLMNAGPPIQDIRINGALRNSLTFAKVWGCPMGSWMNPEKKCPMYKPMYIPGKKFQDKLPRIHGGFGRNAK